jgi:hypothetical protein
MDDSLEQSEDALLPEVLGHISLPGFPEPKLTLKEGMPVVYLRNFSLGLVLTNGTCLLITGIPPHVLHCLVMTGPHTKEKILLPKM